MPPFPCLATALQIKLVDAQEPLACKENSNTVKEGCQCQPAACTDPGESLSTLSNYLGAQGWASLLPIAEGATLAQGRMQVRGTAGCLQRVSMSCTCPCGFSSSSHSAKSREFLNDIPR